MTKASEYYNSIKQDREEWRLKTLDECMWCGSKDMLETHEIERRGQARTSWGVRCNYLKLCNKCHSGPFASMDHARQLACKLVKDPEHFDLAGWLMIKDPELKAPDRVTFGDIARHLNFDSPFKPKRRV